MLRIRLQPIGKKKQRSFRIVVQDQQESRNGPAIEKLGIYDPKVNPPVKSLNIERVEYWVKNGAQFSDTVRALVERYKKNKWDDLLKRKKISKHNKSKGKVNKEEKT